jgi:hypothetical protein
MPAGWVAGGVAAAGIVGAVISSKASKSAAQTQADAANNATAANTAATERQIAISEPWRTAGTTAVNQLSTMTQPGGTLTKDFSYAPFNYSADPGYGFRFDQGMKALNATAAARGGMISGNALRAAEDYGQGLGSQEYGAAFNRYLSNYGNAQNTFQLNRNNLLGPLQFLSGQGQAAAAGQASSIGAGAANNAALSTGAANATAAGQVGSANAYNNAISQGVGQYNYNRMLDRFAPQSQSAYTNYGGYGSGTEGSSNFIGPTQSSGYGSGTEGSSNFIGPTQSRGDYST